VICQIEKAKIFQRSKEKFRFFRLGKLLENKTGNLITGNKEKFLIISDFGGRQPQ
jgi:hypothetical protein